MNFAFPLATAPYVKCADCHATLGRFIGNPQGTSAAITASNPRELRELIRAVDTLLSPAETGALANATMTRASSMGLHHL